MELANRTVLVTGGTSGIGFGLAKAFLDAGSQVIVCGRDNDKITRITAEYPEITALQCDVGDVQQREILADTVLHSFPDLDVLVNNAGIQRYIDLKKGYDDLKSGEDEIAINFVSVVELTALFMEHLLGKKSAAVINISSGLGFMPMLKTPIYSATKAAVHTYSLVLRAQLRDTSVQVIEVVPPMVDTNLNAEGRQNIPQQYRGVNVSEYIPTVIDGLKNDSEIILYGEGKNLLSLPRKESESRLLKSTR